MQDNSRKYIKAMLGLFCAMFLILCVYLVYIVGVYGNRWFTSPYNTRVQAQKNSVQAGRIADRNGQLLAYTDGDSDFTGRLSASLRAGATKSKMAEPPAVSSTSSP